MQSVDWIFHFKEVTALRVALFGHNARDCIRQTAKAAVRYGAENTQAVTGMLFSYDEAKVNAVIADAYKLEGIYYIKVWLNEGQLKMGDDIMYVLIGGDIRPRVVDALQYLVSRVKNECVVETELN